MHAPRQEKRLHCVVPLPLLETISLSIVIVVCLQCQMCLESLHTEKYLPHDPVPIHSGYVLGVYQPGIADSRLSIVHVRVTPGFDYDSEELHMWQVECVTEHSHKEHILASVNYYFNVCRSLSRMLMMLEPQRSDFLWTPGNIPMKDCQMSISRSTKDQHFLPGMMPHSNVMTGIAWQRLNAVKKRRKC